MNKDTILNKAKKDNAKVLIFGIILTGICLVVFVLHWNFLFNAFSGPFNIDKSLLETKSIKNYLEADLPLVQIGSQNTGLKVLGGKVGSVETAKYMAAKIGDRALLVKVDKNYTRGPVKGKILPLPQEMASGLGTDANFYPVFLDCQTGYILDTDLFMILAVVVFPLSLIILLTGITRKSNPASHKAISQLKTRGQPLAMVEQIEAELAKCEHNREESPVYFSDNWIVLLEPSLRIMNSNDLIGFGREKDKNGGESVVLWIRGKMLSESLILDKKEVAVILDRLNKAVPKRYKENAKEFEKAWGSKRSDIEREFDGK